MRQLESTDGTDKLTWTCPACGIRARVPADTPRIFCACGYRQLNGVQAGLGDYVAAGLHRVGVTPERCAQAKAAVGLKRRCGCSKRQQALNALGNKAAAVMAQAARVLG